MELRPLAYFLAACQRPSLHAAAAALGLAPSTLSASLRALEEEVGLPLFRRRGGGLYPTAAARWLYRAALPLLHAESFARRHAAAPEAGAMERLVVEVRLSFGVGRVTKAVSGAIEALGPAWPRVLVEPRWSGDERPAAGEVQILRIGYAGEEDGPAEHLMADAFVLARVVPADRAPPPAAADLLRGPVVVPALPAVLLRAVRGTEALRRAADVAFSEEDAGALPRLAAERPEAAFLVPGSLLSDRLGLSGFVAVPLDPPLAVEIVLRGDGPLARDLTDALRARLAAADGDTVFRPALTLRGVRIFDALCRVRGVTAAARGLGIAQPAVTEQLGKLERALGAPLFLRRRDGLVPTVAGERMRAAAEAILRLETALGAGRAMAPRDRPGRLTLGLPPLPSPGDRLGAAVAAAVGGWRGAHAAVRLRILEAPTATLLAWVREGALDLAVAEWAPPHMPRFALGAPEPLAVVGRPDAVAALGGAVAPEALARLPLVLPTAPHGARRALEEIAREAGLRLAPPVEAASPALAAALAEAGGLFTVLPPSAVAAEAAAGRLACAPIASPAAVRQLLLVYGAERTLTGAERALVAALRDALRTPARSASARRAAEVEVLDPA